MQGRYWPLLDSLAQATGGDPRPTPRDLHGSFRPKRQKRRFKWDSLRYGGPTRGILPTLDDAAPAKPTVAENHATAIIVILNRATSATAGRRYRRALMRQQLFNLEIDSAYKASAACDRGRRPPIVSSAESNTSPRTCTTTAKAVLAVEH